MFTNPLGWFPNTLVSNLFALLVIGFFLLDVALQYRSARLRTGSARTQSDAGSFVVINGSLALSLLIIVGCRYLGLGIVTGWVQYLGIVGMALGFLLREWSVLTLGAFFSKVVEIEQGHQLITVGPYRWLRHPAYTGMLIFFTSTALGLGTWLGAVVAFALLLTALRYRISIEEPLMERSFGGAYKAYAQQTRRLFPGW